MRPLPSAALALSLFAALAVGACSDSGQNVPADEPAQTGSIPADPVLPADPAAPPMEPQAPATVPEDPAPAQ